MGRRKLTQREKLNRKADRLLKEIENIKALLVTNLEGDPVVAEEKKEI